MPSQWMGNRGREVNQDRAVSRQEPNGSNDFKKWEEKANSE